MNLTAIIQLDQPSTRSELEARYARERYPGDPGLIFEQLTPATYKVTRHPAHTAPMDQAELERLLRLRLRCRTGGTG